jgi:hypothetical protein
VALLHGRGRWATGVPRLGEVLPPLGGTSEYYLLFLVFWGCLVLLRRVGQSSFGLVLQGIRENENRMRTLGYNTQLHKFLALVGSGMVGGMAGALLAYHNGFVGPTELHILTSAEGLVMVLVGGPGTFLGPALGAFGVTLVKHWISGYTEYWAALLGIGYILVVRYAPAGLYPPLAAAWARRMHRPREAGNRRPRWGRRGARSRRHGRDRPPDGGAVEGIRWAPRGGRGEPAGGGRGAAGHHRPERGGQDHPLSPPERGGAPHPGPDLVAREGDHASPRASADGPGDRTHVSGDERLPETHRSGERAPGLVGPAARAVRPVPARLSHRETWAQAQELLETFGLWEKRDWPAASLSTGNSGS